MTVQLFDPCQVHHGNQRVRGLKITCGKCSKAHPEHFNAVKGHSDDIGERMDQIASRKFTSLGWYVGGTPGRHRCPTCVQEAQAAKPFAKLEKINGGASHMPTAAAPSPAVDPPREMDRNDRRIIFEKLNEVYADEKTGYSADWTDKRLAEDLGVPRAWVTTVREDMFGPEGGNAAMYEQIAEARKVLQEGLKLLAEVGALKNRIDNIAAATKPMGDAIRKVETTIQSIEKAVRP